MRARRRRISSRIRGEASGPDRKPRPSETPTSPFSNREDKIGPDPTAQPEGSADVRWGKKDWFACLIFRSWGSGRLISGKLSVSGHLVSSIDLCISLLVCICTVYNRILMDKRACVLLSLSLRSLLSSIIMVIIISIIIAIILLTVGVYFYLSILQQ